MDARTRGWTLALATMGVVCALDQLTKAWAMATVARGDSENVFFGIDIVNVRNSGVAFGALSDSGWLVVVAVAIAMLALVAYFARHVTKPGLWLPVGMVFGGAVGNLADRARIDAVIDFVDVALWPAFNLADAAIVVGTLGVLYLAEQGE